MKKNVLAASLLAFTLAGPAIARDTELHLPFAEVLESPEAKEKLDGSVRFFLAGDKTPRVAKRLGQDATTRRTNSVGKTDEEGCRWAALSALIALQDKAKSMGADAVVDIQSNYKNSPFSSATEYECHAGNIVVGVALKGTYAQLK